VKKPKLEHSLTLSLFSGFHQQCYSGGAQAQEEGYAEQKPICSEGKIFNQKV
jgi:hypothetical protein